MRGDPHLSGGDVPTSLAAGRFEVTGVLGSGSMGQVLSAFDRELQREVAVKRLRKRHAEAIYRFKNEFRAVADLTHPNLVGLHELVREGEDWYLVMERVDGVDFRSWIRAGLDDRAAPPDDHTATAVLTGEDAITKVGRDGAPRAAALPPIDRLRDGMRQLVSAVATLHGAGYLHRDLKPSNVLVSADGRVVVLDFGIAAAIDSDAGARDIAGTPIYMAPEQAQGAPSPASDWYSVGVMLFECLTGQRPILGAADLLMRRKQTTEPRRPSAVVADCPPDLDELCVGLMHIAPGDRPDAATIVAAFGSRIDPVVGSSEVIGRHDQLAALRDGVVTLRAGTGGLWYVHGASGIGKTSLLRQFVADATRLPTLLLLAGRCYQREQLPYKAVDAIVDALADHLAGLPPEEVEALVPTHAGTLAVVFPVLRRIAAFARQPAHVDGADPFELRRRAFAALRQLVVHVAARQPLVWIIDDAQWGDADSVPLLAELLRPPAAPPILVVVAYRSNEAASPLVAGLRAELPPGAPGRHELVLGELGVADSRRLAAAALDADVHDPVVKDVARESGGNPFFVNELARHARGRGAMRPGQVSLDQAIQTRVEALPADARHVLEMVAVAAMPLAGTVAVAAAGSASVEPLRLLRSQHLIQAASGKGDDRVEAYHDRIRETVVASLSAATVRAHHAALAAAYEHAGDVDPSVLATHLLAGGAERAVTVALTAADAAERALAFDHAAGLYRLVLEHAAVDDDVRRDFLVRLGRAVANAGRGVEAAEAYLAAAEGAPADEATELQRLAGEQLLRCGRIDRGLATLSAVLASVGLRLAPTPRRALLNLLLRRARLRVSRMSFRARPADHNTARDLMRVDVCRTAVTGLAMVDTMRAADTQSLHAVLALRSGDPRRAGHALYGEVAFAGLGGPGGRKRARAVLARADVIAGADHHAEFRGWSAGMASLVEYQAGHWAQARTLATRAVEVWRDECRGLWFEVMTAEIYRLWSLFYLGEIAELARRVEDLQREFAARGDLYAVANLRSGLPNAAWLLRGDLAAARRQIRLAMSGWSTHGYHLQHYWELQAEVHCDLYQGDGAAAAQRVLAGWTPLSRSLLLRIQLVGIEARHLRARALLAAAVADRAQRRRWLRDVRADAKTIAASREPWSQGLALALHAGADACEDERARAATSLEAAIAAFEHADMRLYAAAARRRLAALAGAPTTDADALIVGCGVTDPAAATAMLVPGFAEASAVGHRPHDHDVDVVGEAPA